MYFWRINDLVKDLRAGMVSEYDKMKYLLIGLLVNSSIFFGNNFSIQQKIILSFFVILQTAVIIWGVYHCFIINKQLDNKNFIERFVCLKVPLIIQFLVYTMIGLFLIGLVFALGHVSKTAGFGNQSLAIAPSVISQDNILLNIISQVYALILSIIYFIVLGRKIAAVAAPEKK